LARGLLGTCKDGFEGGGAVIAPEGGSKGRRTVNLTCQTREMRPMSNWVLVYDDAFQGWTNARVPAPSKESALFLARDRQHQGHEAHRIEGPNGLVINKEEIERWMATHLE
jgi:hypothetical protein